MTMERGRKRMIIILKQGANKAQVGQISQWIEEHANVTISSEDNR